MKPAKNRYLVFMIFFAALLIRLAYVVKGNDIPVADAMHYDALGLSLSQGKGYVESNGIPHSFYPPLYPFFLSLIYRLFGHNYLAVGVTQAIIGSFSCVLIYLIGKSLINNLGGIIAGIITIIYFPFIKSAGLLLTELFFTFLLLLITLLLLKAPRAFESKAMAVLGILLGAAALTKVMMLLYILFIIPVFFFSLGGKPLSDIMKKYSVALVFFIMSLLPWTIRNFVIYHKFIPVATQGGITLYSGYCPPKGVFGMLAGDKDPIVVEADKIACPAEKSNFLVGKTVQFIKENPGKVLGLEVKKILYFWAPFDWEIVGGRYFNIMYVVMAPFFISGFFMALMEFKRFYPVLLPIIYFQLMTLVFYGSPRFRLIIEPFLFIFATIGILGLYGQLATKK
ncbi:MAG: glycosyltransferase family 39 protein [Candidatus Omnitrophica bacterium]|nr:glycosyltransferase family 39 protein [Candidatus Omnitrophota bacterium]